MATTNKITNISKSKNSKSNKKRKSNEGSGPTMMNRSVTGFSFLGILSNIGSLIFGLIFIAIGMYIRSYDDVPLTVVDAKVSSVTWEGNQGCESEEVTVRGPKNRSRQEIQWKCDVVATYNLKGSNNEEYNFSSTGPRYTTNQPITLYRLKDGGTMTHEDPNAWKMIGWIALVVGVLFTFSALFWLWICTRPWGKELCAAKQATNMLGSAFQSTD